VRRKRAALRKVAFISDYPPRRCGIATFTEDLCETFAAEHPEIGCFVVAVNDRPEGYRYPPRVRFEFADYDLSSYRRAADFLNISDVDIVCVQHEYGVYGGPEGSHLLALLSELRMPVVTTLHTILHDPSPHQRRVLEELVRLSDRLVVLSRRGGDFLRDIYGAPEGKIEFIPHGVPDVPFVDPNFYKDRFGVEGKTVLLTFGLLSPNKGIEYAIEALPAILAEQPDVVYLILGATHPKILRREGESYRLSLQRLARMLGVEGHVIFYDRFVSPEELMEFIGAADIYLTPYLNKEQIVSGTLSYAVGAGKAIISTPYWHAEELLAEGRGRLVPFRDSEAIAREVIALLKDEAERHAMRKRAYLYGRRMIWPEVAKRYLRCFQDVRRGRIRSPRPLFQTKTLAQRPSELPPLKLDHLKHLTDDVGILQHAVFTVPNYHEGYTTDDNARALMVAVYLEELGEAREAYQLASRYLAFLKYAFHQQRGRFRNLLGYDRRWLEEIGSEDCHGRALWALGVVLGRSRHRGLQGLAAQLFEQALPAVREFASLRGQAFALLGLHEYLRRFPGDRVALQVQEDLAERLWEAYRRHSSLEWPWFEDLLSYANASLPHALLLGGKALRCAEMVEAAEGALSWLARLQTSKSGSKSEGGHFVPIGSNGFYPRGGERARFDQQPIEAQAMVSASLDAYRLTGEASWLKEAQKAFEWFLGRNDLGLPLYDPSSGGCRDGLQPDRVNENQGAESTLSFLLALLEMRLAEQLIQTSEEGERA